MTTWHHWNCRLYPTSKGRGPLNIYLTSLQIGSIASVLAYLLKLALKYNTSDDWNYWGITLIAFVIGSFIGQKIRESRRKKSGKKMASQTSTISGKIPQESEYRTTHCASMRARLSGDRAILPLSWNNKHAPSTGSTPRHLCMRAGDLPRNEGWE